MLVRIAATRQHLRRAARASAASRRSLAAATGRRTGLYLQDGTHVAGQSFGAVGQSISGEVVFNTGMTGYNETFTDPSYKGQILVMTYPLVGNYGTPPDTRDRLGLLKYFESSRPQISGLVVADYASQYSHWEATRSLGDWLAEHGVPAVHGVDTRMLTKIIRDRGAQLAKLVPEGTDPAGVPFVDPNRSNLVASVSVGQVQVYEPAPEVVKANLARGRRVVHVLAVDCGMKHSILRCLVDRGAKVTVVPWDYDFARELDRADIDALFVSNGPGDPAMCQATIKNLREVINAPDGRVKPVFGICLGHQLLALAAGARTYKMPYGHRSQNQPCIDVFSHRCFITSQNHGYAVDDSRLPAPWRPYFVNANDLTSEGLVHSVRPYFSVQFHPEASCGPLDTRFMFDDFLDIARDLKSHTDILAGRSGPKLLTLKQRREQDERDAQGLPAPAEEPEAESLGNLLTRKGGRLYDVISPLADTERPAVGQMRAAPGSALRPITTTLSEMASAARAEAAAIHTKGSTPASSSSSSSSHHPSQQQQQQRTLDQYTSSPLYRRRHKVLILGSGGLQIGQAGEFDYAGSQAIKALKEEGVKTILINPNIATVQTAEGLADAVYFLPVTTDFVTSVIEKERPDGLMLQFGGQTALNCGLQLHDTGVLERFGVEVLGTSVEVIRATEDREIFARKLQEIGEQLAPSMAATSVADGLKAAAAIGYPVIVRSAFSLGGLGSGFAANEYELRDLATRAFAASPQILVEKSIKGWKELEYEVMRDAYDNVVTVCNMENLDPLGIHTGDSVVVAPSQTLNDHEYHLLRQASINVVRHLGIVGECNVQLALDPNSAQYCVIECNPRLSRSSALASKATGYPLPLVAAKVALGYSLPSIVNSVNRTTTACFEPSLDYIVTKVPRWDLAKFSNVSRQLGTGMKSVGEVMAVGRTFEESLQKALRMVDQGVEGFVDAPKFRFEDLDRELSKPTDQRIWALARALRGGYTLERLQKLTQIDPWFLQRLRNIAELERELAEGKYASMEEVPADLLGRAKRAGVSDRRLAALLQVPGVTVDAVRSRRKSLGLVPVAKKIDTLAAEFPAQANYLYMTYHGDEHDVEFVGDESKKQQRPGDSKAGSSSSSQEIKDVMVLGGGGYRIGSSVEFDYSAVGTVRTMRKLGMTTSMVNFNPETVSTDFDESDRLFFEELSLERVLDIHDLQRPHGTIVSVGGQIPNTLALPLAQHGVRLLGTSAQSIDSAEDRRKFSDLLDSLGVGQPEWSQLSDLESARQFCARVGYPVLVRPSYVLSGGGMKVVHTDSQLRDWLSNAGATVSSEYPVVVSKMEDGRELDFDAVAYNGEVLAYAISEHVERAGVHSGDATLVIPSPGVSDELAAAILDVGRKMARALNITGPFNSQIIAVDGDASTPFGSSFGSGASTSSPPLLKVIECNVRASRSLPLISKALGVDFVELAARAMVGSGDLRPVDSYRPDLGYVCVKSPMFSFTRLLGADPLLGVEMASTGEVACFGQTVEEALVKSMLAATFQLPRRTILISIGSDANKHAALPYVAKLHKMGFTLLATPGTANFLETHGVPSTTCYFDLSGEGKHPKAVSLLSNKDVDLVVNLPSPHLSDAPDEKQNCYLVRRAAADYSVPLMTNLQLFQGFVRALGSVTALTTGNYDDVKEIKELSTSLNARK